MSELEFITEFRSWMSKHNFNIESESNLSLINSPDPSEGRCIISTSDYPPNTLIYTIPPQFLINYRHALKQPELLEFFEWSIINSPDYQLTRLDALYLYLLWQRLDSNSDLYGFVNSMPENYDTPEYWSQDLIQVLPEYLKDSVLIRIEKQKLKLNKIKTSLESFVLEKNKLKTLLEILNDENFRWVFNSVNSRCFYLDESLISDVEQIDEANRLFGSLVKKKKNLNIETGFKQFLDEVEANEEVNNNMCCLIPFVDMLNHCLEPNGCVSFDSKIKTYVLKSADLDDDEIKGKAMIKKNDQVYITYGAHDNKTLMLEYGFFIRKNIYDKITLKEKDFNVLLDTDLGEVATENLWNEVNKLGLLFDLSVFMDGPSWSVLKVIDLIIQINESGKRKKKKKQKIDGVYDYVSEPRMIGQVFVKVMKGYEKDLDGFLKSLCVLDESKHCRLVKGFVEVELELIKNNLERTFDEKKWMELF